MSCGIDSRKTSATPTDGSEALMALQSYPKYTQGNWALLLLYRVVIRCGLSWENSMTLQEANTEEGGQLSDKNVACSLRFSFQSDIVGTVMSNFSSPIMMSRG